MTRTQPRIYTTNLISRPYKHALRFYDSERNRTIIEVECHSTLPNLLEGVLLHLMEWQPDILEKVSTVDDKRFMTSPHKSRRYISPDRDTLYIASPHLTEKFSRPVGNHWIITNLGRKETYTFLSTIVNASGLKREPFTELKL